MFRNLDSAVRQMMTGNVLMVACCVFYLAWWLIAFKPTGAIKGIKSGWLLIPAFLCGVAGAVMIVRGSGSADFQTLLMSRNGIWIAGIVIYLVLLAATNFLLHRQVTTELFLIVGWATLSFLELNALFASGNDSKGEVIFLLILTVVAAAVSLVCYLLYYNLDSVKGYIDGMIPLILVEVMMIVITVSAATS